MKHLISLSFIIIGLPFAFADDVVNVYSARHYDTDMTMYERFTEETGIKVNLIEGSSDALIERIKSEDQFSPADMLITVDAAALAGRKEGIFQPVDSAVLSERIPAHLRHPRASGSVYQTRKGHRTQKRYGAACRLWHVRSPCRRGISWASVHAQLGKHL